MKTRLHSIVAAALIASSSLGDEVRPADAKSENVNFPALSSFYGKKTVKYKDYSVEIKHERYPNDSKKHLELVIKDKDNTAEIFDRYPYGFGDDGDSLKGYHNFRNGDVLSIELECLKNGRYNMKSRLSKDGKCLSESKFGNSGILLFLIKPLMPIIDLFTPCDMGPLTRWGEIIYKDLIDSVINETEPKEMPYPLLIKTFEEIEKQLPKIEKKKLTIGSVLYERSNDFIKAAKQRINVKNKK